MTPGGRRRDAAATRERILSAARRQLAEAGMTGTTIRSVAAEASVDPSMVMRYYGDKRGLFAAATASLAELPDLGLDLPDDLSPAAAGAALAAAAVAAWEQEPTSSALRALLTSARPGSEASARMVTVFADQVAPAVREALRHNGSEADTDRVAALAASHVLGIAFARHVLRLEPLASMAPHELVQVLTPSLQRVLERP